MDLPGVGGSPKPTVSADKRTLAGFVRTVARALGARDLTLVGHDVGGMIVYAYLRAFPGELSRAVIMNVAVPGIEPWSEVVRNPAIWHFAFHNVAALPELLVQGHQVEYFGYFFDAIAANPQAVSAEARRTHTEAYARPEALHTGFEWYRAFRRDAEDNARTFGSSLETPVLYLRGSEERGLGLDRYVEGLRRSGLSAVDGRIVPGSGHFAPDEQAAGVVELLQEFVTPASGILPWRRS
jgi:pimeloyl-ACP methyl ester carboxylesterase